MRLEEACEAAEEPDGEGRKPRRRAQQPSLKQRALRLLALRDYSRQELLRKLLPHVPEGEAPEALHRLLDELAQHHWQSDQRAAESAVRQASAKHGQLRIRQTLQRRGLAADVIEHALGSELQASEHQRAQAVWQRKFGQAPTTPQEWAKHMRFLMARGFDSATARKVIQSGAKGMNEPEVGED